MSEQRVFADAGCARNGLPGAVGGYAINLIQLRNQGKVISVPMIVVAGTVCTLAKVICEILFKCHCLDQNKQTIEDICGEQL